MFRLSILLILLFKFNCTKSENIYESQFQLDHKSTDLIELQNYFNAGPNPVFADTTLYFKKSEINIPTRKIYAKNGDLFTGTQNWFYEANGSLDQTIEIESGKIMIATRFHNDGSEYLKASFNEQRGDTTYQRFYENGELENSSRNWSYQQGSMIYSFSEGEDSEGNTFYMEQETDVNTAYNKVEMFRNDLPITHIYRDDDISTVKSYHDNGQLRSEGTAKNNGNSNYFAGDVILHGLQTQYDEQGNLLKQELYENGILIETIK